MSSASTEEYGVGIVCALSEEMLAAKAMLDDGHEVLRTDKVGDSNNYVVGQVHGHKVVIACLPAGVYGLVAAATAATHMLRTFHNIRIGLMVGIGGGIPEPEGDGQIRLGDIVVSQPCDTHGGVVQHDQGKDVGNGKFILKGFLNRPPTVLLNALSTLKAAPGTTRRRLRENISLMMQKATEEDDGYEYPGLDRDVLFCARCDRSEWTLWHWIAWMLLFWLYPLWLCQLCHEQKISRSPKHADTEVHYGIIASGNVLLKNADERERLRVEFGAKCIEMEAAGLMNDFPCLVIRGICDYADSHKNNDWRKYAAITAAAFAKLLLSTVSPAQVLEVQRATAGRENALFSAPMKQRLKSFFGRKDELSKIATYFNQTREEGSGPQILILHAMGGQGKTQIALEYCQSVREVYKGIFWINGSSILTMTQSLVGIAQQLDHSTSASLPDDEARIKFAISTLEKWKHRWLMVFDNCDDASTFPELQDKFLPHAGQGSILFTSRHRGFEELGQVIEVPPMPHRAGIQLLLHRYCDVNVDNYFTEGAEIVDRLGNLALAIDQASAYLQYTHLPIDKLSTFLPKFLAQREKVLQHTAQYFWRYTKIADSAERETAISAFTTWELSFQQLLHSEPNHDYIAHFLTLSAFFGQLPVDERIFRLHWERSEPPPAWMTIFTVPSLQPAEREDPSQSQNVSTTWTEARSSLPQAFEQRQSNNAKDSWKFDCFWHLIYQAFQLSLIQSVSRTEEVDHTTFTIHPLIRDWLQLRLELQERQVYTREAISLLVSSIQAHTANSSTAQIQNPVLLHVGAVLVCDNEFFDEQHRLGRNIYTCNDTHCLASFYHDQGQYGPSLSLYSTVLATVEQVLGPEHPSTLTSMNSLASVLCDLGKYSEAEQMCRQVVELRERVLGPEHPDTLTSMSNLATVLNELGRYSESKQIYRQIVEAEERVLGPEHPDILTSMSNLASLLRNLGKDSEAEQVCRQVVELRKRVLGPEHPDTLTIMSNLATVLSDLGKYHEAEQMYRQVVEVRKRVLGPEHSDILTSMSNLALVLRNLGKYHEAEQMCRQVVEVRKRVLGPEHPDILTSMSTLALVLSDLGKYHEAEQMCRQVVEVRKRVLDHEHPLMLASMSGLASVLNRQGNHIAAASILRPAVIASYMTLGLQHSDTESYLDQLLHIWQCQGRDEVQIESMARDLARELSEL